MDITIDWEIPKNITDRLLGIYVGFGDLFHKIYDNDLSILENYLLFLDK